jgi:hypothetical protein
MTVNKFKRFLLFPKRSFLAPRNSFKCFFVICIHRSTIFILFRDIKLHVQENYIFFCNALGISCSNV